MIEAVRVDQAVPGLQNLEPSDEVKKIQNNIDFLDEVIRTLEGYSAFNERFIRKMSGGEAA